MGHRCDPLPLARAAGLSRLFAGGVALEHDDAVRARRRWRHRRCRGTGRSRPRPARASGPRPAPRACRCGRTRSRGGSCRRRSTNGVPSLPRRSSISPSQPASAASAATMLRVAARPKRTTSTGSGNLPSVATRLEASAMTIMRSDAMATIFSRSSAPPPPLMSRSSSSSSSAPSTVRSRNGIVVERGERNAEPLGLRARAPPRSART